MLGERGAANLRFERHRPKLFHAVRNHFLITPFSVHWRHFRAPRKSGGAETSIKTLGDLPGSRIGLVDREGVALRILTHGEPCHTGYTNLAD